jgi:hypothetical protein
MKEGNHDQRLTNERVLHRKLDAVGWSLFFIWIGIAFLADVGWGLGLLGVGIITLGAQAARKYFGLRLEGFWIVVGFFFVVGGIWELYKIQFKLWPILFLIAGIALLVSTLAGRREIDRACGIGPCLK